MAPGLAPCLLAPKQRRAAAHSPRMAAEWIEKTLSLRCFGEAGGSSSKPETPAGVGAANNKIEMEEGGADLSAATAMTPISLIETIRGAGIPHGTRVRPWLILGSAADAVDAQYLREHGVTVVLSVADEVPVRPPAFVTYHCVPVKDYVSSGEYQRETLWRIHTIIGARHAAGLASCAIADTDGRDQTLCVGIARRLQMSGPPCASFTACGGGAAALRPAWRTCSGTNA